MEALQSPEPGFYVVVVISSCWTNTSKPALLQGQDEL